MTSGPATMALLAMLSVGLWTLRVALAARGRRLSGAGVAAAEAVTFALVFSKVVADLGSVGRIAGYAAGVAIGTVIGLVANDRFSPGGAVIEVIVAGDGAELRDAFHAQGWPATTMPAAGIAGSATVLILVVRANRTDRVLEVIRSTAPDAVWAVRPATAVHGSPGMGTPVSV